MIEVHDNLLEPHIAELISDYMKDLQWKFYYHSDKEIPSYHWHIFCGHNESEAKMNGFEMFLPIWQAAQYKLKLKENYDVSQWKRLYANAHTFGVEPNIHKDDGDFTMIYYPDMDWKIGWGGGTFVYKEDGVTVDRVAEYRGNRVLLFTAKLPHQAQTVARLCPKLRTCIVFKLFTTEANEDRLDFYKD